MGLLFLTSCDIEYNSITKDDFDYLEDSGEVTAGPVITPVDTGGNWEHCISFDYYERQTVQLASWPEYNTDYPSTSQLDFCEARDIPDSGGLSIHFVNLELSSFEVIGFYDAELPTDPIRIVGLDATDEMYDDGSLTHHYPNKGNYYSGYLTAVATGVPKGESRYLPTWRAEATSAADLGSLNDCAPDCQWQSVYLEIFDYARSAADTCSVYANTIAYCPTYQTYSGARARTAAGARCRPGSGRFYLLPVRRLDRNRDGLYSFRLRPIMVSGSGVLTGDSTVFAARTTDPAGTVPSVGTGWVWNTRADGQDRFAAMGTASVPLSLATDGDECLPVPIAGSAPFMVEQVSSLSPRELMVDLAWTCDRFPGTQVDEDPPGYSFALADLGCGVDWEQQLTLRLEGEELTAVSVEAYGLPASRVKAALSPVGTDRTFQLSTGDLELEGSLTLRRGGAELAVSLDRLSYSGAPLCPARTLILPRDAE